MYFPADMNFQYFFFDTYIGYFLQALPFALAAGGIYGLICFRKDRETPVSRKVFGCLFVCYLTGLVCLTLGLDLMNVFWYRLFYFRASGHTIYWFSGGFDLVPDFFHSFGSEALGNFLMLLPFGVLYPLVRKRPTWKNSVLVGFITVLVIETLQPVFGRAFDINDVILNTLGIVLSSTLFMAVRKIAANFR